MLRKYLVKSRKMPSPGFRAFIKLRCSTVLAPEVAPATLKGLTPGQLCLCSVPKVGPPYRDNLCTIRACVIS